MPLDFDFDYVRFNTLLSIPRAVDPVSSVGKIPSQMEMSQSRKQDSTH